MKQNQKPCIKTKKVINRGKISKTLSEVELVENIIKNPQTFLEISPVQKEVLLSQKEVLLSYYNFMFRSVKFNKIWRGGDIAWKEWVGLKGRAGKKQLKERPGRKEVNQI